MCARLLSHESLRKQNRFSAASERFFERVIAGYGRWLKVVLAHQWLTLCVALSTLAVTVLLYLFIPKGFFPIQDNGLIQGTLEAPQSVSFSKMAVLQQQVAAQVLQDPAVESLTSFIGVDGTNAAPQQRPAADQPEAAERTQRQPADHHRPDAGEGGSAARPEALSATGARSDHRHPGQPHAVPVHPAGDVPRAAQPMGTAADRRTAADARAAGRQQRLAGIRGWRPISTSIATRRHASASR